MGGVDTGCMAQVPLLQVDRTRVAETGPATREGCMGIGGGVEEVAGVVARPRGEVEGWGKGEQYEQ